jgi:hypothetical protein
MSNFLRRHSEEKYLVRYLDGELSPRKTRRVERHLECCGPCRAELEELQSTVAECARYRQDVLVAQLPPAPQPWRDLYRDFSRIDESLANESLLVRLMRPLVHSGAPRWSFAAGLAALMVVGTFYYQLRQAPSVQAATWLRKAVEVSESKPRAAHRIRVRTSHQQEFTRLAGARAAVLQVAETQVVMALFQAAHYDWNDPLSARAFEQWRDAQVHKTDEVTKVPNPQVPSEPYTQIRTHSADGELAEADITFDSGYSPVEERLEFRDAEWVELSEIAETSMESAGGAVAEHVEVPARAAEPPSRPAALPPGSSASISDEIQVLSALNEIGADLGELEDIALTGGKVVVTGGEGIPPQRQQMIRDSLASIPHVEVQFTQPQPAPVPAEIAAAASPTAGATVSPMQSRLEKQLGGHAEFDRFTTQLLDVEERAMQQVYALHNLARKFSPQDEAQLNAKDLSILHELSRKHTDELAKELSSMERILVPTLSSLGGSPVSVRPAAVHASWQPASEDVYQEARRMDRLVSQILGMAPGSASVGATSSDLLATLKDLDGDLKDCRQFLQAR